MTNFDSQKERFLNHKLSFYELWQGTSYNYNAKQRIINYCETNHKISSNYPKTSMFSRDWIHNTSEIEPVLERILEELGGYSSMKVELLIQETLDTICYMVLNFHGSVNRTFGTRWHELHRNVYFRYNKNRKHPLYVELFQFIHDKRTSG